MLPFPSVPCTVTYIRLVLAASPAHSGYSWRRILRNTDILFSCKMNLGAQTSAFSCTELINDHLFTLQDRGLSDGVIISVLNRLG